MPLIILVADDDLGTRLSVSDYLEMSGYSVITAENGQQALSMIETYHPHLLVTDINMPRIDGYELVRKVRQKPPLRLLPVVFLTELNSTNQRIKGYQSGCDVYLPKPFEMQELGAVIQSLLVRSQMIHTELRFSSPQTTKELVDKSASRSINSVEINHQSGNNTQAHALQLTEREQQVLNLLATGLSNVEIGNQLHLSPRTIEKYVSRLFRKTDTSNRAELLRFALEHHLIK
ncbi:MAG: response regulator transcription factor [Moorea sp. SIO3I7]|uniref:DNA-binding response regulator n=1 Tax=Moorena bouillonii PNG TaxID=568701 RepID=A0A1U7MYI7_9CYAN|nr:MULTISPECIES: response regulator transcription factor [Moorena]NEN96600.1 response regulator transcription factor [Moorena sp. SIO3I7]NEO06818.1 response regulator transcription factor [Moorena sp. SIO3I8]NEO45089.1 response regulator transcription factor [Moorena sp. SIO4A3]OLT58760.1 DNA-binding response regulator [Moorena bouillonii PNG]